MRERESEGERERDYTSCVSGRIFSGTNQQCVHTIVGRSTFRLC